jgi:hypothetical protein
MDAGSLGEADPLHRPHGRGGRRQVRLLLTVNSIQLVRYPPHG